jgi:hypothetical protein
VKIEKYFVSMSCKPITKGPAIFGAENEINDWRPLVYLKRPKWIKNDDDWEQICKSVRIDLPKGFQVRGQG